MQTVIYHIDNDFIEKYGNCETLIDAIINDAQERKHPKIYTEQKLKDNISDWKIRLYMCDSDEYQLKRLSSFYSSIVEENQPILRATKKDISTLLFIYDNDEMFVVPTGFGYFSIQEFLDYNFGLKIMSSIVDINNSSIKNISYKSISGQVALSTRLFRNEYSLLSEDDFGKLFNEICATIPKETFIKTLGLGNDFLNKDIICTGKSSFKISKTINTVQLFDIITKLKPLLERSKDIFNNVRYVNNKGADKDKVDLLNKELLRIIYDAVKNGNVKIPFDISHRDYYQYHMASSFQIFYDGKPVYDENLDEPPSDLKFLIDASHTDIVVLNSFEEFCAFVDKIVICSYDSSSTVKLTNGKFIKHINGEISFKDEPYFYIGEQWMQLENDFVDNLNRNCKEYLGKYFDNSVLTTSWSLYNHDIKDENGFIDKVCEDDSRCIKIHPCKTSENLELCDIIKKDDNVTQLIYIKDGFTHSIRDLTSQVSIAQQRILEMKKTNDFSTLENYYDRIIKSKNGSRLNYYDKKDFIDMFKNDNLTFVLAFRATTNIGRTFKDSPAIFKSNIAKYSLIHTLKEITIRDISFTIKLCEINNT